MDDPSLIVLMDREVAGYVQRHVGAQLEFTYDPSYAGKLDATPLSTSMPLASGTIDDPRISDWLWGLLPDNVDVLKQWARSYQTSLGSPFGLLESPVGRDCAGAVRFVPPDDVAGERHRAGSVEPIDESGVAALLRRLIADRNAWLPRTTGGEFSLAGAQAKTALHCHEGMWGVPSGDTPSTHILKPAIFGFDDHDLNEHLCLEAARRAGLACARTWIGSFEDQSAIVIERYDRTTIDGRLVRVHQEDLCQALGRHPSRKYQRDGGPTPVEIVTLLRQVIPVLARTAAVDRFADALIWNWIIVGTDAHAKNYSLLLSGDQVRLAPLYDIGSILPYDHAHPKKWRFAMKYGGHYDVATARNPWPRMADELSLDAERLTARVLELCDRAPDAFSEAIAALPEHVAGRSDMPRRLLDAVAERATTCRRITDGSFASSD